MAQRERDGWIQREIIQPNVHSRFKNLTHRNTQ